MIQPRPRPDDGDAVHPTDPLTDAIAARLASLFLAAGCADMAIARRPALETIASYRARNHADLRVVAQTVSMAFAGIAACAMAATEGAPLRQADRPLGRVVSLDLAGQRLLPCQYY